MKLYNKIYSLFGLGLGLLAFASCSDSFLDKTPDERTEIDNVDKVVKLLVTSYPTANPSWVGEINSDNLIDNQSPHLPSSPNSKQILSHYNYAAYDNWDNQLFRFEPATQATYGSSESPGSLWQGYYSSIASVNAALQAIDKLEAEGNNSETLRPARGEALLIRAYSHFMLANIFCPAYKDQETSKQAVGVTYMTEPETKVLVHYDRGNLADTYTKIEADLLEGLKYISDVNFNIAPKYHFNTAAAKAFAARFYLFKKDYKKVIQYADEVLGTDTAQLQSKLMDYSAFEGCTTAKDYGNAWQSPDRQNNLMLIPTYSVLGRRVLGYRYSCAGPAAREALMIHSSPLWNGYICPAQLLVSGQIFSVSGSDYGYFSCKIQETFEYTDPVAGIGYPHVVYRAFTNSQLLLERAEAEAMLGQYDKCAGDLMCYWNDALKSFSTADYNAYIKSGNTKFLTKPILLQYYGDKSNTNCFEDWSFAQQMGINVPKEAVPYMNCINDFRRLETVFEGMRFFDIKRWGMDLTHTVGLDSSPIKTTATSKERAIEVPWEALSAGLATSRPADPESKPKAKAWNPDLSFKKSDFVVKTK